MGASPATGDWHAAAEALRAMLPFAGCWASMAAAAMATAIGR